MSVASLMVVSCDHCRRHTSKDLRGWGKIHLGYGNSLDLCPRCSLLEAHHALKLEVVPVECQQCGKTLCFCGRGK